MSIENLTLLTGPTIAVTGGTTQTFAPDGTSVIRGVQLADISVDSPLSRQLVVAKNTQGTQQPDKTWSKDRRSAKIVIPAELPDGSVDWAQIEVSMVKSPLRGAATVAALKEKAVQLITDTDFATFWLTGSTK